jgi:hypothetical protein
VSPSLLCTAEFAALGPGGVRAVRVRAAGGLLVAVFVLLPLSTSGQELACALGLLVAMLHPAARRAVAGGPLFAPMLGAALVVAGSGAYGGPLVEGLGHAWLLAPLCVIPALASLTGGPGATTQEWVARARSAGLYAAAVAAAWAVWQRLRGEVPAGPFSHHLTLAYALLPPFAAAVHLRRFGACVVLVAGVLATGSEGALVALPVAAFAAWRARPLHAWGAGAAVTLVGLVAVASSDALRERAVLWTGGLAIAGRGPVGPGGYAEASVAAYDALQTGFYFPNHAHDASIELLATTGWPGLVAMTALVVAALRLGGVGAAGLAAVLVGAWTQDVLGDLEVARAAWAWVALEGLRAVDATPQGSSGSTSGTASSSGSPPGA